MANVYIVGLGGQGVLSIGEMLAEAAQKKNVPVNFYPTKGMSQRGGFVQAQLRMGEAAGPALTPGSADLIVALERSEALKGVRYAKKDCDFILFDDTWNTVDISVGKAKYPELDGIRAQIEPHCGRFMYLSKDALPVIGGKAVRSNMFLLGVILAQTALKNILDYNEVAEMIRGMWPKAADNNLAALQAGYQAAV
jgi:indolepyruvate ferredoxin oxidoreductase beta subunit